ncbi:MmgE/PrpD family protein [Paracoccus onubensis]|uniref:MmgE/PrpD family protein n=1 Tax=Paracoccus onubensis TaxID=1675788 RepID=UPI001C724C25|nr:MmgE/PrpD family protein [Paracoccus onubensis]
MLDAYCDHSDPSLLTRDLGEKWEIRQTCFKRYAAHITVHGPAEALREIAAQHRLKPQGITGISLEMSDKVLSHHNIPQPEDIMSAQYSVPFMTAAALHVDLDDPRSVTEDLLHDPHIRKCSETIDIRGNGEKKGWGFKLKLLLQDGNIIERAGDGFSGASIKEAVPDWLDSKFGLMVADVPERYIWEEKLIEISGPIDAVRSP